ncbi:MAG: DUF1574 family protein [Candidatus Omnitrophota bacterium]
MFKNITTSSFKGLPVGLLAAAVLILLTESFIYSNRAELTKDYWNKFLINEHVLLDSPGDYDYLIMGDSIQKTGIRPLLVDEKCLNLGLPGGKPMSLYLMLNRYLKNHKAPKVIFLYVDPEDQHDSLNVILRYFVNLPEFISIWKDLTPSERQIFITRYLASLDLRKVNLTKRVEYTGSNKTFVEEMKANRGYMPLPNPGSAIGENYFVKDRSRYQSHLSLSKKDMKYLGKFMKLAASKNIKIVFLGFLLPRELYDIFEKTGFNQEYRAFYEGLKNRYPEWNYVKDPIYVLDNQYFGDRSHLNNAGSELYSGYFKDEIFTRPL